MWDQSTLPGFFESISTIYLSSNQTTIIFSNIPTYYTHLQIRAYCLTSNISNNIWFRFNSDNNPNYASHELYGSGSAVGAIANTSSTFLYPTFSPGPTQPGSFITDVLDYKSTNKNKTTRTIWGYDVNGAGGYVGISSGLWFKSPIEAINSITIGHTGAGATINAGSHFALYGIRG